MKPARSATVRDVARRAGVSTATVSRALEPATAALVAAETRRRVQEAAAGLHYAANQVARSLKTRTSRTVAVVAPEFANDFFMDLAEGMEAALEAEGYTLLVASSSNSVAEEEKRLATLFERQVDAVVVIPAAARGDHLQALAGRGLPVVLVDRLVEGAAFDAALSDNEAGAYELAGALLADGYRRLAFVGGDVAVSTARERLAGFGRALAGAGLSAEAAALRLGGMGIADGYRRMDEILALADPPDALFAVNLLVHLGLQRRLREAGPNAAGRFAVAAFDETPYSAFLPSCRYTAAQDAAGLGQAAVRLALDRIAEVRSGRPSGEPRVVRLPVRLIRHGAAAAAATGRNVLR